MIASAHPSTTHTFQTNTTERAILNTTSNTTMIASTRLPATHAYQTNTTECANLNTTAIQPTNCITANSNFPTSSNIDSFELAYSEQWRTIREVLDRLTSPWVCVACYMLGHTQTSDHNIDACRLNKGNDNDGAYIMWRSGLRFPYGALCIGCGVPKTVSSQMFALSVMEHTAIDFLH